MVHHYYLNKIKLSFKDVIKFSNKIKNLYMKLLYCSIFERYKNIIKDANSNQEKVPRKIENL